MTVPSEECRSTRGFQTTAGGILPIYIYISWYHYILIFFYFFFRSNPVTIKTLSSTYAEESTIGGEWEMPPPEPAIDMAQSSMEG